MRVAIFIALFAFASIAQADLLISFVKESSLPYELSPRNYDNSSSNYDNSITNYDNSPSNYDNSESNYNNSPSNYKNGLNGNNRLIVEKGDKSYRVGYYVRTDNGLLNFFSIGGERLFYNAGKSVGVFHGKEGFFCGVLAWVEEKYQLALTEKGKQVLMLAQYNANHVPEDF
jgi:hypothetical protein